MKTFTRNTLVGALGLALLVGLAAPASAGDRWRGPDHRHDYRAERHWHDNDRPYYRHDYDRRYWRDRGDARIYYVPRYVPYRHYRYYDDDDWRSFIRFGVTIPLYID